MDFLKKLDLSLPQLLKFAAIFILLILVLSTIASLFGKGGTFLSSDMYRNTTSQSAPSIGAGAPSYNYAEDGAADYDLSARNVAAIVPAPESEYTSGTDAEAFEVKEYHASIETRTLEKECEALQALKSREEVIFENAQEYSQGCNYTFKVANDSVPEILAILKNLNPRELSESTYTIKNQIDDYTSEEEILTKKLASIDKTLKDAIASYDTITGLATTIRDAESLAKIIESKLTILERLTNEQLRTSAALERLMRSKANQLDRLSYTYFYVNVYESTFVNGDQIKDSWKQAVQELVQNINTNIQQITVGSIALLFLIVQYALYFFVLLIVAKYGWNITKKVWGIK